MARDSNWAQSRRLAQLQDLPNLDHIGMVAHHVPSICMFAGECLPKSDQILSLPPKVGPNPVQITLCAGEASHKCTWSKCYLNLSLGHKGLIFVVLVNQ